MGLKNRPCEIKIFNIYCFAAAGIPQSKMSRKKFLKINTLFTFRPVLLSFLLRELIFICLITDDLFIEKFLS